MNENIYADLEDPQFLHQILTDIEAELGVEEFPYTPETRKRRAQLKDFSNQVFEHMEGEEVMKTWTKHMTAESDAMDHIQELPARASYFIDNQVQEWGSETKYTSEIVNLVAFETRVSVMLVLQVFIAAHQCFLQHCPDENFMEEGLQGATEKIRELSQVWASHSFPVADNSMKAMRSCPFEVFHTCDKWIFRIASSIRNNLKTLTKELMKRMPIKPKEVIYRKRCALSPENIPKVVDIFSQLYGQSLAPQAEIDLRR